MITRLSLLVLLVLAGAADAQVALKKQPGWVGALAFAPDSATLAVGTGDGGIALWRDGEKIATLQGHADAVVALAFSGDASLLVSGGHDHAVVFQSPKAAFKPAVVKEHTGAVMSLALSKDGTGFFSGGIDATIRHWDVDKRKVKRVLRWHKSWVNGLAFDEKRLRIASAGSDNRLLLRELDAEPGIEAEVKEGEIRAVALSPAADLMAAGIRYGHVRVFSTLDGKVLQSFRPFTGETWAVAFTPDGKTLAAAGGDWNQPGAVRLWDVETWKEKATLKHTGEVLSLAISPDGRKLAAGGWDRNVLIWDLDALK